MKRISKVLFLTIISLFIVSCGKAEVRNEVIDDYKYEDTSEVTNFVKIEMKDGGIMLLELYPEIAPITVENFQNLVKEKAYDGSTFHRVVKNFMIQGGKVDKDVDNITGEFEVNGIANDLKHERGVISMARGNDYDSATSQFFIVHKYDASAKSLNGKYAAFGKMLAGFNTLDEIANTQVNGETPVNTQTIRSIKFIDIIEKP